MVLTKTLPSLHASTPREGPSVRWDRVLILASLLAFWALVAMVIIRWVSR